MLVEESGRNNAAMLQTATFPTRSRHHHHQPPQHRARMQLHIDNTITSFTTTHPITSTNSTTFHMSQPRPQIHSCSCCSS